MLSGRVGTCQKCTSIRLSLKNRCLKSAEAAEKEYSTITKRFKETTDFKITSATDAISHAICGMAVDIGAKADTSRALLSGMTARSVSRFRCPCDVIGLAIR